MENESRRRDQITTPHVGFGDRDRVQFRSSILCNFRSSMTVVGLAAAPGYGEPLAVDLRAGAFARRAFAAGGYILCLTSVAAAASWAGLRLANWWRARGAWQWVIATGAGLAGTLVALYALILGTLAMAGGAH